MFEIVSHLGLIWVLKNFSGNSGSKLHYGNIFYLPYLILCLYAYKAIVDHAFVLYCRRVKHGRGRRRKHIDDIR